MGRLLVRSAFPLLVVVGACVSDPDPSETPEPTPTSTGTGMGGGVVTSATTASTGGGTTCFDYEGFEPTPDVSLELDVLPIFAAACNGTSCHGNVSNPDASLYLGPASGITASHAATVHAELVGATCVKAPSMQRVIPGDPANSFLMIKLDGDVHCPQVTCGNLGCGARMPAGFGSQPLDPAQLHVVRSWIANGAPAN